jgi:hypothetical protein
MRFKVEATKNHEQLRELVFLDLSGLPTDTATEPQRHHPMVPPHGFPSFQHLSLKEVS